MSSSEYNLDLTSSVGGSEQDGGNLQNDFITIALIASSCTLLVLCATMIGVIANKNYCK